MLTKNKEIRNDMQQEWKTTSEMNTYEREREESSLSLSFAFKYIFIYHLFQQQQQNELKKT